MEKFSFLDILFESWRLSFTRFSFFLFGFLIALPAVIISVLLTPLEELTLPELQTYLIAHWLPAALLLFGAFIFTLYGKGNLIVTLNATLSQKSAIPKKVSSFSRSLYIFKKVLLIDLVIFGGLIMVLLTLSLPSLIAFLTIGSVPKGLVSLGIITLLPVIIIGFFLREFTFFYFLLSPLRLFPGLEAGANFFLRFRSLCLLFGALFVFTGLLFTFSLNLVMLGIVALLQTLFPAISTLTVFFIGNLIAITWYEVFRQTLWLTFFTRLATPKDPVPEEAVPILKEEVSEIPSA